MKTLFDYALDYASRHQHPVTDDPACLSKVVNADPVALFVIQRASLPETLLRCVANIRVLFGIKHYEVALALLNGERSAGDALRDALTSAPSVSHRVLLLDAGSGEASPDATPCGGGEGDLDVNGRGLTSRHLYHQSHDVVVACAHTAGGRLDVAATSPPGESCRHDILHSSSIVDATRLPLAKLPALLEACGQPWKNVETRTKFVFLTPAHMLWLRAARGERRSPCKNLIHRVHKSLSELTHDSTV